MRAAALSVQSKLQLSRQRNMKQLCGAPTSLEQAEATLAPSRLGCKTIVSCGLSHCLALYLGCHLWAWTQSGRLCQRLHCLWMSIMSSCDVWVLLAACHSEPLGFWLPFQLPSVLTFHRCCASLCVKKGSSTGRGPEAGGITGGPARFFN
jgi:hypothetical protein